MHDRENNIGIEFLKYSGRTAIGSYLSYFLDPTLSTFTSATSGFVASFLTSKLKDYGDDKSPQEISLAKCKYIVGCTIDSIAYSGSEHAKFAQRVVYSVLYENIKLVVINDIIAAGCAVIYGHPEPKDTNHIDLISEESLHHERHSEPRWMTIIALLRQFLKIIE